MPGSKKTVEHLTYFVVQAYKAVKGTKGQISAENPREARDQDHALMMFDRLKETHAGVVAFRRTGSPATGEWDDAVVIARFGLVPAEVDDMREAAAEDDGQASAAA